MTNELGPEQAPTGMIFIPCIGGLSHNEGEAITAEWATAGADVLLHAVLDSAGCLGASRRPEANKALMRAGELA